MEADQDVRKNHLKQLVTAISECGLAVLIVYKVLSLSCCRKAIAGNALGLISFSLQVSVFVLDQWQCTERA